MRTAMKLGLVWVLLCGFVTPIHAAIIIDAGPTYTPPGMGTAADSGTDPARTGGRTYSYSGFDLSQTVNLYYGIKNDVAVNGYSMNGPQIAGTEIFRFDAAGVNFIRYTGSTDFTYFNINLQRFVTVTTDTRLTITFSGGGNIVQDSTTMGLSNANGDVGALWVVLDDFSANFFVEARNPLTGGFQPGNELFDALQTPPDVQSAVSFDTGFYYQALPCNGDFDGDGDVDGSDLAVFAADFGRTDCCEVGVDPCEGDFDGDCDVDGSDLALFAADFGRTDCPLPQ